MLKFSINPVSNQEEANFNAQLVSVGDTLLKNSNGKEYAIATIRVKSSNLTARIYKANLDYGVTPGKDYLCTATKYMDAAGNMQVDIRMSHLPAGGNRIALSDFVALFGGATTEEKSPAMAAIDALS